MARRDNSDPEPAAPPPPPREQAKKAGCFAATVGCIGGCVAGFGRWLGRSWCAVSPVGRIFTQLLFSASLIAAPISAIPALEDLYWGWILMVFACVGSVFALFYGWEERLFGPKMPNLDRMTPGKPMKRGCFYLTSLGYWISLASWAGIIGTSAYILFLYISPLAHGFTSTDAVLRVPPQYCDRVIGQSSRWIVPTTSARHCDDMAYAWAKGAASTAIGIAIMLLNVFLGSCLHGGSKAVLVILAARQLQLNQAFDRRKIVLMQQQIGQQQVQIGNQQSQIGVQQSQIGQLHEEISHHEAGTVPAAGANATEMKKADVSVQTVVPAAAEAELPPIPASTEALLPSVAQTEASVPTQVTLSAPTYTEPPATTATSTQV